jgi:hypothetical protein
MDKVLAKTKENKQGKQILSKGSSIYATGLLGLIFSLFLAPHKLVQAFCITLFGISVMALGMWASRNSIPHNRLLAFIKRHIGLLALILFGSTFIVMNIFSNKEYYPAYENHEMTWSYVPYSSTDPESKHVILRFVNDPSHIIGIFSEDLRDYLESLPDNHVTVIFEVRQDSKRAKTSQEIKIGGLTEWHTSFRYEGHGFPNHMPPF